LPRSGGGTDAVIIGWDKFRPIRSEGQGAGTNDSCLPAGDGAAMSQSAPLDPRTRSLWPTEAAHGDVHGDGVPYRPPRRIRENKGRKRLDTQGFWRYFRDSEYSPGDVPVYTTSAGGRGKVYTDRARTGPQAPYPEYEAQSHKYFAVPDVPCHLDAEGEGPQLQVACPQWAIVGECESGHPFSKELICNREWCTGCGGDGGKAHQRRIAGKLGRARQLRQMGKWTITIPPEVRYVYRDPHRLAALGVSLKRMFQYHGYLRGFRRFHFFGEDHPQMASGLASPPVFHPHLEAIVDGGHVSKGKILSVRKSVARILGVKLARINVHYQYTRNVGKMMHLLRYMLRPTFENYTWDVPLAHALIGFRNAVSWGTWKDSDGNYLPALWDVPETDKENAIPEALQEGCCPDDGTKITWGGPMRTNLLQSPWWFPVGGGYWQWSGLVRDGP